MSTIVHRNKDGQRYWIGRRFDLMGQPIHPVRALEVIKLERGYRVRDWSHHLVAPLVLEGEAAKRAKEILARRQFLLDNFRQNHAPN